MGHALVIDLAPAWGAGVGSHIKLKNTWLTSKQWRTKKNHLRANVHTAKFLMALIALLSWLVAGATSSCIARASARYVSVLARLLTLLELCILEVVTAIHNSRELTRSSRRYLNHPIQPSLTQFF